MGSGLRPERLNAQGTQEMDATSRPLAGSSSFVANSVRATQLRRDYTRLKPPCVDWCQNRGVRPENAGDSAIQVEAVLASVRLRTSVPQSGPSPLRGEGSVARSEATWRSWVRGAIAQLDDMRSQRAEPTDRTPHPGLLIRFAHKRAALSPEGRGEIRWVAGNLAGGDSATTQWGRAPSVSFADTSAMLRIGRTPTAGPATTYLCAL